MEYPEDFKKRVRSEFLGNEEVDELLETGAARLGDVLEEYINTASFYNHAMIIGFFEKGEEREILKKAEKVKRVHGLYKEWFELWRIDIRISRKSTEK